MTSRPLRMLNERDRRYVGTDAAFMINIAKRCTDVPSTISAFVTEVVSGSPKAVNLEKMLRAATYHADKLAKFAAALRIPVAELLYAARVADDLSELRPAPRRSST